MSVSAAYLLFWIAGLCTDGLVALAVLYRRRVLSLATSSALLPACLGFLVGSKWQSQLEWMPLPDALFFPPIELVTGGRRIDLGLLLGMTLALAWAAALRVPSRHVGDALAVGATALMAIGRLGCMAAGCCMGAVCPAGWPFCARFPAGTEAYNRQLDAGLIGLSATHSLPAHALPAYFAVAALVILAILVLAMRRGARPGALLALFAVLHPATKLALDTLRATPSPSPLMTAIPLAVLVGTIVFVTGHGVSRLLRVPLRRRAWSAMLCLVVVTAGVSRAADDGVVGTVLPADWAAALQRYAGDPWSQRRELRRLARHGDATLPPIALLALGDARLRSGSRTAAARYFTRVLEQKPGEPWEGYASVGLGWIAVADGDLDAAQRRFAAVAESGTPARALAVLVIAMVDAQRGEFDSAISVLDALADMTDAAPPVRHAALLVGGYVRYWAGHYREAAEHLDRAGINVVGSPLWDDARYAAALARAKLGDGAASTFQLRALGQVASVAPPDERITPALLALEPGTLLRTGLLRYRRLPFAAPDDQIIGLMDRDGPELARVNLRRLGERIETPAGSRRVRRAARAASSAGVETRSTAIVPATPPARGLPLTVVAAGAAVAFGIAIAWWHRERLATPGRRLPR